MSFRIRMKKIARPFAAALVVLLGAAPGAAQGSWAFCQREDGRSIVHRSGDGCCVTTAEGGMVCVSDVPDEEPGSTGAGWTGSMPCHDVAWAGTAALPAAGAGRPTGSLPESPAAHSHPPVSHPDMMSIHSTSPSAGASPPAFACPLVLRC